MHISYQIYRVQDHYEVYVRGRFLCSADTMEEAVRELECEKEKSE